MASFIPRLLPPALLGVLIAACGSGEGSPAALYRSPYDSNPPADSHDAIDGDGRDIIPTGPDFSPTAGGGGSNNGQGQGGSNQAGTDGQGGNGESGSAGSGQAGSGNDNGNVCGQCANVDTCTGGQLSQAQCEAKCDKVSKACESCANSASDCDALLACQNQCDL